MQLNHTTLVEHGITIEYDPYTKSAFLEFPSAEAETQFQEFIKNAIPQNNSKNCLQFLKFAENLIAEAKAKGHWDICYTEFFNKFHSAVKSLEALTNTLFEYADPDADYEDDVMAAYYAFKEQFLETTKTSHHD